jgi:hypothetical protein
MDAKRQANKFNKKEEYMKKYLQELSANEIKRKKALRKTQIQLLLKITHRLNDVHKEVSKKEVEIERGIRENFRQQAEKHGIK